MAKLQDSNLKSQKNLLKFLYLLISILVILLSTYFIKQKLNLNPRAQSVGVDLYEFCTKKCTDFDKKITICEKYLLAKNKNDQNLQSQFDQYNFYSENCVNYKKGLKKSCYSDCLYLHGTKEEQNQIDKPSGRGINNVNRLIKQYLPQSY